ncbi:hypothetical protein cypCar_00043501, partial [Cyprinus carpio]
LHSNPDLRKQLGGPESSGDHEGPGSSGGHGGSVNSGCADGQGGTHHLSGQNGNLPFRGPCGDAEGCSGRAVGDAECLRFGKHLAAPLGHRPREWPRTPPRSPPRPWHRSRTASALGTISAPHRDTASTSGTAFGHRLDLRHLHRARDLGLGGTASVTPQASGTASGTGLGPREQHRALASPREQHRARPRPLGTASAPPSASGTALVSSAEQHRGTGSGQPQETGIRHRLGSLGTASGHRLGLGEQHRAPPPRLGAPPRPPEQHLALPRNSIGPASPRETASGTASASATAIGHRLGSATGIGAPPRPPQQHRAPPSEPASASGTASGHRLGHSGTASGTASASGHRLGPPATAIGLGLPTLGIGTPSASGNSLKNSIGHRLGLTIARRTLGNSHRPPRLRATAETAVGAPPSASANSIGHRLGNRLGLRKQHRHRLGLRNSIGHRLGNASALRNMHSGNRLGPRTPVPDLDAQELRLEAVTRSLRLAGGRLREEGAGYLLTRSLESVLQRAGPVAVLPLMVAR